MKTIFAAAVLTAISTLPALAADKLCNGQYAMIRISTLKSPASRPAFDKAVADQIAWYRAHGLTANKIVSASVIDLKMGAPSVSATEVMTIHYDPPAAAGKQPASDDDYKAFVQEFRNSSDIASEKLVCLPK